MDAVRASAGRIEDRRSLAAERDELREEVKRLKEEAARNKPLSTRERETYLKIILGMAIEGYGYNPTEGRSHTPREIADDLATLGISVCDDTVRQKLKDAFDTIDWSLRSSKRSSDKRLCNGPFVVNPFLTPFLLLYGLSAGLPPDGVRRGKGRSNLKRAGSPGFSPSSSCIFHDLTQSIVPAGTPLREGRCLSCPKTVECFSFCAAGCEQFLCPAERRFSVLA